jgi:hypothetical protein
MLVEAKELYASAEARANDTIEQEEELVVRVRAVEEWEWVADQLEQKLQEREALNDLRLERELTGLATRKSSLVSHEAALMAEQRDIEGTLASDLAQELATDGREGALETRAAEVADRERLLADLHVVRLGEAQKVWDFLGPAESALVPFSFSPLLSRVPAQEVSAELPLLDSAGAKMLELEDVIASWLEAEGRILAKVVMEHVLLCLRSRDP